MKVVTVVGARPQFVKAAVLRQLFKKNGVRETLLHTGQHYDHNMSTVFFEELDMPPPEYSVELQGRTHGSMTGEILTRCETVLQDEMPDLCLVYGDTNSTLAGALAAAKMGIPVCHVEAGLRSFNKAMPEEINRILTDHVSELLFCPTHASVENLRAENITDGVHHVGDIMYDAVRMFARADGSNDLIAGFTKNTDKPIAVLTIHRQGTVDSAVQLESVLAYCRGFTESHNILFPVHPRTRARIEGQNIDIGGIRLVEPLPYLTMQALLSRSNLLLTDSGGMQKEAYFHRIRCVTLRDETEWGETIAAGWNRLWTQDEYACEPRNIAEYGDGRSGEKILKILSDRFTDTVSRETVNRSVV